MFCASRRSLHKQKTLFGTVVEKGRFFKGLPSADDDAGYYMYAVVEALWMLDKSNERVTFFASA